MHECSGAYVDGGLLSRDLQVHSDGFLLWVIGGGEVGRTRHRYGIRYQYSTSTSTPQFVSLSYDSFLSFSFSFYSFVSFSLGESCWTEELASYEMVRATYSTLPPFPSPSSIPSSHRNPQRVKQAQKPPTICSAIVLAYPRSTCRTARESAVNMGYGKTSTRASGP